MDNDTYAEPIQRLSDLEWLSYKEHNRSVIDDMFTGQLVEAQHCLACNRVSVGIQTFNILPVPIVEARQLNGLVYLEDCFTKFGNIEDMFGTDGLRCENCSKIIHGGANNRSGGANLSEGGADLGASPVLSNGGRSNSGPVAAQAVPMRRGRGRRLVQPPVNSSPIVPHAAMSPIVGGGEVFHDSGYHDNNIRTSTPIGAPPVVPRLTDGQKRSLLRQLPECLVVQLMRFTVSHGQTKKIQSPVSITLTHLDLTRLIIDNVMRREDVASMHTTYKYSLYGMCVHLGADSTSCGHYVAYIKAVDNSWYRCDDSKVMPVNMEYELNTKQVRENAYLLFYKKVM